MPTPPSFIPWTLRLLLIFQCICSVGCATEPTAGGYRKISAADQSVVAAAQFAVKAQSAKARESTAHRQDTLELIKIIAAQEQVVAGTNYRLKLSVKENGREKTVEAVVWWQAWRKPNPYELTSWR